MLPQGRTLASATLCSSTLAGAMPAACAMQDCRGAAAVVAAVGPHRATLTLDRAQLVAAGAGARAATTDVGATVVVPGVAVVVTGAAVVVAGAAVEDVMGAPVVSGADVVVVGTAVVTGAAYAVGLGVAGLGLAVVVVGAGVLVVGLAVGVTGTAQENHAQRSGTAPRCQEFAAQAYHIRPYRMAGVVNWGLAQLDVMKERGSACVVCTVNSKTLQHGEHQKCKCLRLQATMQELACSAWRQCPVGARVQHKSRSATCGGGRCCTGGWSCCSGSRGSCGCGSCWYSSGNSRGCRDCR